MRKCELHPPPQDIDFDRLRQKYHQERDRRLRPEGADQYVRTADKFAEYYEVDPHALPAVRDPISEDIDVVIIGGGFCGLLAGARLKEQGVHDFRIVDWAGDFGGVWYWNRYPGIQCDNESYCYIPLLEETGYVPKSRFPDGAEIYEHCQRIGRHYGLYEKALFGTMIKGQRWDDSIKRWRLTTQHGDDIRARYVVLALGSTHRPKLPGVPGIADFKGRSFHSSRWDYDYTGGDASGGLTKLGDKRVALIGTGASAIQIAPYAARYAQHLYVFQRTPSSIDHRGNVPTDPEWVKTLGPGWQKERQRNFQIWGYEFFPSGQQPNWRSDAICDFWTEINRNIAVKLEAMGWPQLTPEETFRMREEEDFRVMERLRRRCDALVDDRRVAEALKPYYSFICKRACSNDDYLQIFNRSNVTLVDVSDQKGVERITEKGIVAGGLQYEVDCIIFASGFEVTTDLKRRYGMPIEGRNGLSLYDHWADNFKTFHGMTSHGFPNQFYTGFTQAAASGNITAMYDQQVTHIAYIIGEALRRGAVVVEPSEEAQNAWIREVHDTKADKTQYLLDCTPSYWNGEGGGSGPDRAKKLKWIFGDDYGPGIYAFEALLEAWRTAGDMQGLVLEYASTGKPKKRQAEADA